MKFKRITIIGVGLIGGSIGLAARKRHLAKEVVGVFRRSSTMKKALAKKAVDRATMSIAEGVKGADIIIVASPVYSIPELVHKAMRHAKEGAIITDVGSTKTWIIDKVAVFAKNWPGVSFVGSHPMAGSEHAGVEFSEADLLDGSPCIVTKQSGVSATAIKTVSSFWRSLGARVSILTPRQHDKAVALVSHLPHLAAFSLAGSVPESALKYAAEGFKDTTRVASSDPKLWADILISNRSEVLSSAETFKRQNNKLIEALRKSDYNGVVKILSNAKSVRNKLIHGKTA